MMEEAKLLYVQDRASWMAKNFWLKTYRRGNWDLINDMNKLNRLECRDRMVNPRNYVNVFTTTYREVRNNKREIEVGSEFPI